MKLFYFDLETTGVKFWKNGIHQISGLIEINGKIKEEFNFHVKPFAAALVEPEALAVANITAEDLEDYSEMEDVYQELNSILSRYVDKFDKTDKFFLVGYNNAAFDNPFFRAFFVQNGDNYFGSWFWSSPLDVFVLASQNLINDRAQMKDFKLKTVAAKLGIEVDESQLHNAKYDIYLTRAIYKEVTKK